jgi:hypothetical protein
MKKKAKKEFDEATRASVKKERQSRAWQSPHAQGK